MLKDFVEEVFEDIKSGPGGKFNPVFLYGEDLSSLRQDFYDVEKVYRNKGVKGIRVNASQFYEEFTWAEGEDSLDVFRKVYRSEDYLIIEGIDKLAGKVSAEKVCLGILKQLYDEKKLIIMTADVMPVLCGFSVERLENFIMWGVVLPVEK